MQSAMKGVKKVLDRWGCVDYFVYRGVKITRIGFWDYIARCHSWWYCVDGRDGNFPSLTEAKYYIDKIKKVGK